MSGWVPVGAPPTSVPRTAALCDDRAEIRRSLQVALSILPGLDIVAEAWDVASCGQVVQHLRPDLLVLDVNIPGGGPAAARLVKAIRWSTVIVAYSGRSEPHIREEMLDAGAGEYVLKTGRIGPLLAAITRLTSIPAPAHGP